MAVAPPVDAAMVRQLLTAQFPEYAQATITPVLPGGADHLLFRIGPDVVARFARRSALAAVAEAAFAAETAAMTEFAAAMPFATPRTLAVGRAFDRPWRLQSWVAGTPATSESHAGSTEFAAALVQLIRAMRQVPVGERRFDGRGRGGQLMDVDAWVQACIGRSAGLLDVDWLGRCWAVLRTLPPPPRLAMCHRDLIPANLLCNGDQLVGVLDAGSFGAADPALDLVAGWHLLDQPRRQWLRARLGDDDASWQRGAAWAFAQAVGLVWYYDRSHPAMADLGRVTLARLRAAGLPG